MKTILHYYGHSCFRFDDGQYSLVIDPFKNGSVPNLIIEKPIKANKVLLSHHHDDHDCVENVQLISSSFDVNVDKINSFHDKVNGKERGNNVIHVILRNGLKIVHLGDLGDIDSIEDIFKIKNADVVLIPINGYYTIGAEEAYELISRINPKLVIPMHYYKKENNSGYKDDNQLDKFLKLMKDYQIAPSNEVLIEDYLMKTKCLVM